MAKNQHWRNMDKALERGYKIADGVADRAAKNRRDKDNGDWAERQVAEKTMTRAVEKRRDAGEKWINHQDKYGNYGGDSTNLRKAKRNSFKK